MYAVVKTGGKQYTVYEGDVLRVEKLDAQEGSVVELGDVLLLSDDAGVSVGRPIIENAVVEAKVLEHDKADKIVVFKYKSKKNYRKKQGHRQPYTLVQITKIASN